MSKRYMLVVLLVLSLTNGVTSIDRESVAHTLRKREAHFDVLHTARWKLKGDAHVSDGAIVLTRDERSQAGSLWSLQPVEFPDWEIEMEFQVPAKNSYLFGDGLVLWYVDDHSATGNVFGYKDYFKGLGLFLDTYCNHNDPHSHNHPYISLMVNDGTIHYDHDQDGTHTQAGGCEFPFRHTSHSAFIRLRYSDNKLTLHKRMSNEEYSECFAIADVELPTHYHFGVTAATGDLSDEHRVISFRVKRLNAEKPLISNRRDIVPRAQSSEHERGHVKGKPRSSRIRRLVKVFLISVVVLACIVVAVYMLSTYYYDHQRRSKRLY